MSENDLHSTLKRVLFYVGRDLYSTYVHWEKSINGDVEKSVVDKVDEYIKRLEQTLVDQITEDYGEWVADGLKYSFEALGGDK